MVDIYSHIVRVQDFLNAGGPVLLVIMGLTFLMWLLMGERLIYLRWRHPREVQRVVDIWKKRTDDRSWYAMQIRRYLVSEVAIKLQRTIPLIKTCVALCTLLGLLGTVTGMIDVFEVMSFTGGASPRPMAEGISRATLPTMAGMIAAISGVFLSTWLERKARAEIDRTGDLLTHSEQRRGKTE